MMNIATLITCFNRKEKTLRCISDIKSSIVHEDVRIDIYVVDGGSKDGTMDAIKQTYPDVFIRQEDGLFWAGGMRAAWQMATEGDVEYDFFWLVNDDTLIYQDTLQKLLDADVYAHGKYGKGGLYVGSTTAIGSKRFSYGGRKLHKWGRQSCSVVLPDAECHECDMANANILLVSSEVFKSIGGFCAIYTHGIADYDYSLRAVRAGFPVLVVPGYCGECEDDHGNNWVSPKSDLKERIKYLKSPKGLAYKEYLYYIKEFFPKEYASSWFKLWLKTICPQLWERFKS